MTCETTQCASFSDNGNGVVKYDGSTNLYANLPVGSENLLVVLDRTTGDLVGSMKVTAQSKILLRV